MSDTAPKKALSSRVVYENPWITIHEDQTITTDGQQGVYAYLESRDSVMVAPVDAQNRVFLQRAFRYPSQSWGWELPGGGGDNEDLIEASKRELEEETGILCDHIEKLGHTVVCDGLMSERQTTCVAWGLHFDGTKEISDEVFLDQRFFSFDEIHDMVQRGEIDDNQTITGLYLVEQWLKRRDT